MGEQITSDLPSAGMWYSVDDQRLEPLREIIVADATIATNAMLYLNLKRKK